ncbi:MAG: hypothetical protein KBC35_04680 [Candidatus Pacebacteria bacterium]|nr:hypothetical protein [Candidatus Paceibacterota bacterium]
MRTLLIGLSLAKVLATTLSLFRTTETPGLVAEHIEFDPRIMPASQFRIKAFYDSAHEHIALSKRFGKFNYYST